MLGNVFLKKAIKLSWFFELLTRPETIHFSERYSLSRFTKPVLCRPETGIVNRQNRVDMWQVQWPPHKCFSVYALLCYTYLFWMFPIVSKYIREEGFLITLRPEKCCGHYCVMEHRFQRVLRAHKIGFHVIAEIDVNRGQLQANNRSPGHVYHK